VRKSYLKHLERCLKKNYEDSNKATIEQDEVAFHAKHLEKKALRLSMRVGIYQRYMVREMEAIKKASKKNLIHPTFSKRKFRRIESAEKETQTEETSTKCEEKTEMQNMLSSAFGVDPGYPGEHEGIDSYEELLNILTSSPHLMQEQANISQDYDATLPRLFHVSQDDSYSHSFPDSPKRRLNLDERLQQLGLWCDEDNEPQSTEVPKKAPEPVEPPCSKEIPIRNSIEEPAFKISKRSMLPSDWSEEVVIQTELMEAILKRKSPLKRAVIQRRFRDLFGYEGDLPELVAETSQEELLEARRHVAGQVVKALTPFYMQGRIGTRLVFKSLAKRITDRLLAKTMTPDPKEAKKEVKICFALKPEILTPKDIDHVFTSLGNF
ncbi:hypothetical protein GE061_013189, partial [Apolygus lucorum]